MVAGMTRGVASLEFPSTYTMLRDSLPVEDSTVVDAFLPASGYARHQLSWNKSFPLDK